MILESRGVCIFFKLLKLAMEKIEQILQYKWVIVWAFTVGVFCGMVITEKLTKK